MKALLSAVLLFAALTAGAPADATICGCRGRDGGCCNNKQCCATTDPTKTPLDQAAMAKEWHQVMGR